MKRPPSLQVNVCAMLFDTRILSLAVRGACFDLFLFLNEELDPPDDERFLFFTMNEFGRLLRCTYAEVSDCLKELKEKNIFEIDFPSDKASSSGQHGIKVAITEQNKAYGW